MAILFYQGVYINASGLNLESPCAALMDQTTGKILFEKNSKQPKNAASLMKIMNMLLTIESIDQGELEETDPVTVSDTAANALGADVWLKSGESITVKDLLKAISMVSANDAALALAEYTDGSEGKFVARMNEKSASLHMENTIFKDCIGSDEDGNITSAHDVAVMAHELMKHKSILPYTTTWIDHIRDGKTQIVNTNKLLKTFGGTTGIKTGTTQKAGSCIAACAEKNGVTLIAVILGCKSPQERFKEVKALLEYGFDEYTSIAPKIPKELKTPQKVKNGMENEIKINVSLPPYIPIMRKNSGDISSKIDLNEELTAPLSKNQKIGTITYLQGDEILCCCDITTATSVEKVSFKPVFRNLINEFLKK